MLRGSILRYLVSKKLLFLPIIIITSCIYTFSGGYPAKLRKVYIEHLKNRSERQDITLTVENLFLEDIQKDGRLSITAKEKAGLEIIPVLEDFRKVPTEFTEGGEVTIYTVTLRAIIRTPVRGDSLYFLKDSVFSGRGVYRVGEETEIQGIERAVNDLVNNFLDRLFSVRI